MGQTALIIEVDAAEAAASPWRTAYDPVATRGVPAHITVLFPFAPSDRLDRAVLERLTELATRTPVFDFDLTSVDEFPGTVWLRPEPETPFTTLTHQIWSAFPDFPPYGGRFSEVHPHLTLASVDAEHQAALAARIREAMTPHLPIRCRADALSVFVSDDLDRWRREHRLPFAVSGVRTEG
jgi:2'-5' RNA ligase